MAETMIVERAKKALEESRRNDAVYAQEQKKREYARLLESFNRKMRDSGLVPDASFTEPFYSESEIGFEPRNEYHSIGIIYPCRTCLAPTSIGEIRGLLDLALLLENPMPVHEFHRSGACAKFKTEEEWTSAYEENDRQIARAPQQPATIAESLEELIREIARQEAYYPQ